MHLNKILFALLAMTITPISLAQTIPNAPHIIVKGMAETKVAPDTFNADFLLKEISFDLKQATNDVEKNTAFLIDSAKRHGAKPADLKALNIQIGPVTEYNEAKRKSEFSGNQVSRNVRVKFKDKKVFQKFLSTIPLSQTVQLLSVRATLSTYKELEASLFKLSAIDAKSQAQFMADTFDLKLLNIYTITSNDPAMVSRTLENVVVSGNRIWPPEAPSPPSSAVDSFGPGNTLEEGELNFMKSVYIVYLVQDNNSKLPKMPESEL
jgi:uncharacterized protein YggE